MPEDLPTPSKSAKQIEQEKQNKLKSDDKMRLNKEESDLVTNCYQVKMQSSD